MDLRRDLRAASPLVVILVFVLAAAGLTALVFYLVVDTTATTVQLQEGRGAHGPVFEVVRSSGGLAWSDVQVTFVDRSGTDRAGLFLVVPEGPIEPGQTLVLRQSPPGGTYLLQVFHDEEELDRLVVRV